MCQNLVSLNGQELTLSQIGTGSAESEQLMVAMSSGNCIIFWAFWKRRMRMQLLLDADAEIIAIDAEILKSVNISVSYLKDTGWYIRIA